jgi:hypothetical protein
MYDIVSYGSIMYFDDAMIELIAQLYVTIIFV